MSNDNIYTYKKENLDDITLDYMKEMAIITMKAKIENFALLGCSSNDFILFSGKGKSQVSFRNYCGNLEMLITDINRNFLIYTQIDGLSFDELLEEYYRQFLKVKHLIEKENHKTFDTNWFNEDVIKGFGEVYDKFSKNKGWIKIE